MNREALAQLRAANLQGPFLPGTLASPGFHLGMLQSALKHGGQLEHLGDRFEGHQLVHRLTDLVGRCSLHVLSDGDRFVRAEACLHAPQGGVDPGGGDEVVVPALLDETPVVEHVDVVRMTHGRETVGDDERGAAHGDASQRALDGRPGLVVHGAGRPA